MASPHQWFENMRKAFDLRTKAITTSSSVTTYTAKVGGSGDDFIIDRVIQITSTSGNNMTITVPDAKFAGQQLLVVFVTDAGGSDTVSISTTTGDNGTQLTATSGWSLIMWIDDTNGWIEVAASAT
jgi:hypothetical protein